MLHRRTSIGLADVTGECSATAVAPTTTDACAGVITGTTSDPLSYTTQGTHVITWNFDDGNGNSINVEQNVLFYDITPPEIPVLDRSDRRMQCHGHCAHNNRCLRRNHYREQHPIP